MSFDFISRWWHEFIDHLSKHPQADQIAHPAIAAVAQAAQPARVVDPLTAKLAGYTGPTDNLAPLPEAKPIPAFVPGVPNRAVSWDRFDGSHPVCDFGAGVTLKVSLSGEPKDKGCVLSMTRVDGPDAHFTVTNGILSGTSNDWTVQLAPGSDGTELTSNVTTRYGLAIRP